MTDSLSDSVTSTILDLLLSCHISANILALTKGSGYRGKKCANQHLTANACYSALGTRLRSVSVTPYGLAVRDNWKGRAAETALTDRRRQSCRTPSKPSWPLAFSLFLLLVSRKKSSKSPWSWKKKLWRSSDLELLSPGFLARHTFSDWRHFCLSSKDYRLLACCLSVFLAPCRKCQSWSKNRSSTKKDRRGYIFFWPGAFSARPFLFPVSLWRGVC